MTAIMTVQADIQHYQLSRTKPWRCRVMISSVLAWLLLLLLPMTEVSSSTTTRTFLKGTERQQQQQQQQQQQEQQSSSSSYSSSSSGRSQPPRQQTRQQQQQQLHSQSQSLPLPSPPPPIFHIIPHSHCDAAYKKTLDEYYETEVRNVLDSVVEALSLPKENTNTNTNTNRMNNDGSNNINNDDDDDDNNDVVNDRTFVWAETVYLTKWWKDVRTNDEQRTKFQQLVTTTTTTTTTTGSSSSSSIIEVVNGGWIMHDEGITRYDSQIHQMTDGHDRLMQMMMSPLSSSSSALSGDRTTDSTQSNNGVDNDDNHEEEKREVTSPQSPPPRITTGWQIDPFGPSPYTFQFHVESGMDFLVLNRVPPGLKDVLKASKTLQFYWRGETTRTTTTTTTNETQTMTGGPATMSSSSSSSADDNDTTPTAPLLVHIMDTHYASPDGYDWENIEHGHIPIEINDTNIHERTQTFMDILLERSTYYRTPHILVPMGGDFTYQNATTQFNNIERIMGYVNSNKNNVSTFGGATLIYSTPRRYKDAVLGYLKQQQHQRRRQKNRNQDRLGHQERNQVDTEEEGKVQHLYNTQASFIEINNEHADAISSSSSSSSSHSSMDFFSDLPTMTIQDTVALQPLWVGYYFTAPNLKQMVRTCEITLRATEIMLVRTALLMTSSSSSSSSSTTTMTITTSQQKEKMSRHTISVVVDRIRRVRDTVSMMQHHDAITATSYRFVIADYIRRLRRAFGEVTSILTDLINAASHGIHDVGGDGDVDVDAISRNLIIRNSDGAIERGAFDTSSHCEDDHIDPHRWYRQNHGGGGGKIIGGGPYLHESVLVRDAQSARTIHIDKVLNPPMGFMEGIDLHVINSLAEEVESVVHFVCTRDDVAISSFVDLISNNNVNDGGDSGQTRYQSRPIVSQATPLEEELDGAYNFGLFLISFTAKVPAFGSAHFKVQVCDLSWTTAQDHPPPLPFLECAIRAVPIHEDELLKDGLTSSKIHVRFDPQTLDIASLTKMMATSTTKTPAKAVATKQSLVLNHDFVLYDGTHDNIYIFNTTLESSNPPPLLGDSRRTLVSGYRGPLFSQVTLKYTDWLSIRYRVLNASGTEPSLDVTHDALQATVFAGPLPPAVNVASRFAIKSWWNKDDDDHKDHSVPTTPTDWYLEENGFLPVQVSYNTSLPVGDGNTRPFVSRTWLQPKRQTMQSELQRLTITTVDPRGVVSKGESQIDIFWHRRNTGDWDWWKKGNDGSSVVSSVWLTVDGGSVVPSDGDTLNDTPISGGSRKLTTRLSNDLILLSKLPSRSLDQTTHHRHDIVNIVSMPSIHPSLHVVTFRLSQVDPEIPSTRKEESWVDIQIENISDDDHSTPIETDLSLLLANCSRCLIQASSLYSLTYLLGAEADSGDTNDALVEGNALDAATDLSGTSVTAHKNDVNSYIATSSSSSNGVMERRRGIGFDGCSLEPRDGGIELLLSISARRICSIRVPVMPLDG